jgi:hypothetical protein
VLPGGAAGADPAKFRRGPAAGPVGTAWGWSRGCYGPTWEVGPVETAAGDARRRHSPVEAVGATALATQRPMRGNRWWWRLLGTLGEGWGQLLGRGS